MVCNAASWPCVRPAAAHMPRLTDAYCNHGRVAMAEQRPGPVRSPAAAGDEVWTALLREPRVRAAVDSVRRVSGVRPADPAAQPAGPPARHEDEPAGKRAVEDGPVAKRVVPKWSGLDRPSAPPRADPPVAPAPVAGGPMGRFVQRQAQTGHPLRPPADRPDASDRPAAIVRPGSAPVLRGRRRVVPERAQRSRLCLAAGITVAVVLHAAVFMALVSSDLAGGILPAGEAGATVIGELVDQVIRGLEAGQGPPSSIAGRG